MFTFVTIQTVEQPIVIFDGNALMYRAFHALPPLTDPGGKPINAIYGLISMLFNIHESFNPKGIIFCFDEKGKTFRNKLLASYQSQRPPMPPDLSIQFERARLVLKSFGIPVYSKKGFEADDVIATIASKLSFNKESKIVIVTGDRDLLQLVSDEKKVSLYMPVAGLSGGKEFKFNETVDKMGVKPDQIPDYKALVGDQSDNYFGVNGIGPKTACNLLSSFGTLDGVYDNLKDIKPSIAEKLVKEKDNAFLSQRIATVDKNVPIIFDVKDCLNYDLAGGDAVKLFEDFGFKTLKKRLLKIIDRKKEEMQTHLF